MAKPLKPPVKIRPLDPDKPLMPTRSPALKAFDKNMPGQLTLDQMGAIELPEGEQISEPQAAAQENPL